MSRRTTSRGALLELAILGLLHDSPMHGYELRKQLNALLGAFRALSYGTLYPCLRELLSRGWIGESPPGPSAAARSTSTSTSTSTSRETTANGIIGSGITGGGATRGGIAGTGITGSRRARIVYELTAEGKDQFQALVSDAGPSAWEDDTFNVHFAFFARTEAEVRLRILEGRRSRLEERLAMFRAAAAQRRERLDLYTAELQRHGLDSAEREVRWLSELIETERTRPTTPGPSGEGTPHS